MGRNKREKLERSGEGRKREKKRGKETREKGWTRAGRKARRSSNL